MKRRAKRIVQSMLVSSGVCVSGLALAAAGSWSGTGPYGGTIYQVMVHPTSPTVIYSATRGGLFRSVDNAASWQRIESGLAEGGYAFALAQDRDAPDVLWVTDTATRISRSLDGGDTWNATGWTLPANQYIQDIQDVAGVSGQVLVLTRTGQLYKSVDNGTSFLPTALTLPADTEVGFLQTHPSNPDEWYVGVSYYGPAAPAAATNQWLYRTVDGGATWSVVVDSTVMAFSCWQAQALDFGPGNVRYMICGSSVLRSVDAGATWTVRSDQVYSARLRAHPTDADQVYIGRSYPAAPLTDTFLHSNDGGATFSAIGTGLFPNLTYGNEPSINAIALHPSFPATPRLFLGSESAGLFRSEDEGNTFTTAHEGIEAVNIRALSVLPNPAFSGSNRRIYAGYGDPFSASPALYLSNNAGTTWSANNNQLRAYQIRDVEIDPTTVGSTAPALASTVIYASGRSDPAGNSSLRNGGLYKSTDGGTSWSVIDAGLPTSGTPATASLGTVRTIVLDPRSCASPPPSGVCISGPLQKVMATATGFTQQQIGVDGIRRTVYSHRVVRSVDAGATWAASDSGLPTPVYGPTQGTAPNEYQNVQELVTPVPLVIAPSDPNTMYLGTYLSSNQVLAPGGTLTLQNGVFKSVDGGLTWTHASSGLPRYAGGVDSALDVLSLAIHPSDPNIVWATLVDLYSSPRQGFIYKTLDGGTTWQNVSAGLNTDADIRALVVDAGDPNILYAAGAGTSANPGAVYKSTDGGVNWLSMSIGLPADAALALEIDPFNPSILYAGTNAAVWQIEQVPDEDGDGAPDQVEGNAPNGGDGNGDGLPDAEQSNVGSSIVQLNRAGQSVLVAGSFTAQVVSGTGVNCNQMVDVQGQIALRFGRDYLPSGENAGLYYAYPQDLVRFELPQCEQAVVDLTFHAPGLDFTQNGWTLRMYGPQTPGDSNSLGWYPLGMLAQAVDANTWRLTLSANAFGSYRPDSDAILFVGGPAFFDTSLFSNGFED